MRKILLIIMILFCSVLLFSEEVAFENMDIQTKLEYISNAVKVKDPNFIKEIYNYNKSDPDYEKLVNFLVEKAGDLVFHEDYNYAFKIIKGVLYNNLGNKQAQELYHTLDGILKGEAEQKRLRIQKENRQKKLKKEKEERLRLEAQAEEKKALLEQEKEAKIQAEKKAIKDKYQAKLKKEQEHLKEAEAYKSSISNIDLGNFTFYSYIFPADFLYYVSDVFKLYNSGQEESHSLYGMAAQAGVNFIHPLVNLNFDMNFDYGFIGLASKGSQNMNYSAVISAGSPTIKIPLTVRLGYFNNQYFYKDTAATDMAIVKLPSLSLGLGLWNLVLFDHLKIDFALDYYLVSLFTKQMDGAFGGELELSYRIYKSKKLNYYAGISTHGLLLLEEGMIETNINAKIGIGISYNE